MPKRFFFPALLALLAWTPVASAGPDSAEYERLSGDLAKNSDKAAWPAVEKAYKALVEGGHTLTAEDHLYAAQAAGAVGDMGTVAERLRAAGPESEDAAGWLGAIEGAYGEAQLTTEPGGVELVIAKKPFQPELKLALAFAAAEIQRTGSFDGLLPAGDYTFGPEQFNISPGGARVEFAVGVAPPTDADEGPACPRAKRTSHIAVNLDDAEVAYAELELDVFTETTDQVRADLPCLTDEVIRPVAARIHRFEGLRAFTEGNEGAAVKSFGAARLLEPNYTFPAAIAPEGNPVLDLYVAYDVRNAEAAQMPAPKKGRMHVDGVLTLKHVEALPAIVQIIDDEGSVTMTAMAAAGEWPTYDALPAGQTGAVSYDGEGVSLRTPLLVGAGATAGTALVLQIVAMSARGKWNNPPGDDVDAQQAAFDKARTQHNTFHGAALAVGVVSVGLGTGAMLTGTW